MSKFSIQAPTTKCPTQGTVMHYIVSDRQFAEKVVIRGFPSSTDTVKDTLNYRRFSIIKIFRMKNRNGKLQQLLLGELS